MRTIFDYAVVGVGAAGLSFIRQSQNIKNKKTIAIDRNIFTQKNHLFGYWNMPWTKEMSVHAHKQWKNWSIINQKEEVHFFSEDHPYGILYLDKWKKECLKNKEGLIVLENYVRSIKKNNEIFEITLDNNDLYYAHNIIDSRTVRLEKKYLKQHFLGLTIETQLDVFDEHKLILMDFRVDQSKGLHFIYLVPFSKNKALIESTMFSYDEESYDWYKKTIEGYLMKFYKLKEWNIVEEEKGSIPMTLIKKPNNNFINIGTMSGAMKPSSGYAISFIQKQIFDLFKKNSLENKNSKNPHKAIDLWMDKIFLKVITLNPKLAIEIIINLGKSLNGDEFSLFMSGQATNYIRLKVVLKMPKKHFIKALFTS
jgi:lycopene beta-cyclase|tara:strand:- start:931 stop:2031 length:1101 start_codon:yes stop_codon:yes gene_type:complete